MVEIYIDADACPVKDEALRVADRHNLQVYLVSNSWLSISVGKNVKKIVVPAGADIADDWIVEHITATDIAITADILLADRCLKKGAKALGVNGKEFHTDNIGTAKAMRELHAHLRELGEAGHNPTFSKQDRSRFLQSLEMLVRKA